MDLKEVDELSLVDERKHWWIKTRFLYIDSSLKKLFKKKHNALDIIEFGCGTAQNLWYLENLSQFKTKIQTLLGIDPGLTEESKNKFIKSKKIQLSNQFTEAKDESADLILAMDVLEHIEDEQNALTTWSKSLRPNGIILITVPAFQSLWSYHDDFLDHKRRYTKEQLVTQAKNVGLTPIKVGYAFSFIFPLVYLIRKLSRPSKSNQDLALPPFFINKTLYYLGKLENLLGGCPLFGTSVIGIFKKS